jgi:hypothetical protein
MLTQKLTLSTGRLAARQRAGPPRPGRAPTCRPTTTWPGIHVPIHYDLAIVLLMVFAVAHRLANASLAL